MAKEQNKYEKENADFLAKLLQSANINPNEKFPTDADLKDSAQAVQYRGEGLVEFLAYPTVDKISRICTKCKNIFVTNYPRTSFCSMHCIELYLKERYKLAWFPHGNIKKEKWEIVEEPKKVPMRALVAMKTLLMDVEKQLGHSIPTESGDWADLPESLTPEILQRSLQNLPEPVSDSEQPQTPAPEQHSSRNPEPKVQSEQSQKDLEDWLFD